MTRLGVAFRLCLILGSALLSHPAEAWSPGGHRSCCVVVASPGSVVVVKPNPVVIMRPSTIVGRPSAVVIVPRRVEMLVPLVPSHLLAVPSMNRTLLATGCCVEFFPDPGWFSRSYTPLIAYSPALGTAAPPPPVVYVTPVPTEPDLAYVPSPSVEPAPEVKFPTGRWERHGNGVDYPYVWVWVPEYRAASAALQPTSPPQPSAPATR